jgi:hypothetical protein
MLKLAIIKSIKTEDGKIFYRPILEGEDGEFKRELTSRIRRLLGPKKSFSEVEITRAIDSAFEEYKREFKERTVKLS